MSHRWSLFGCVALVCGVCASSPPAAAAQADNTVSLSVSNELRARGSSLDDDEFELAGRTATRLLASAGISAEWRDCRTPGQSCGAVPATRVSVVVRLRPLARAVDPKVCGEVAHDYRGAPVLVVYLAPHAELVGAFRFHVASRANPALSQIRMGHLVGLTIAHEAGHWLGLSHARSGVMTARPGLDEVEALAARRLAFDAAQGAKLRVALRAQATLVAARR